MSHGLKGTLEGLSLEAIVQALALSGQTGVLTISSGEKQGRIYFWEGKISGVKTSDRRGKEAFFEILSWHEGEVSFSPEAIRPEGELFNVEALFMEAATYQSEQGKEGALSVLLVEDSQLAARTLSEVIESSSKLHLLEVLSNGEEALWAAAEYQPDVILLDLYLPGLTGSKAFKHLMIKHPAPVVLTSSRFGPEVLSLLLLGAVAFCLKSPHQAEHLPVLLEKAAQVRVEALRRYRLRSQPLEIRENLPKPSKLTVILSGLGGLGEALEFLGCKSYNPEEAVVWILEGCPEVMEAFAGTLKQRLPWEAVYVKATTIVRGGTLYLCSGFPSLKKGPVLEPEGAPDEFWRFADLPTRLVVFSGVAPINFKELKAERVWVRDPETSPAPALPASLAAKAGGAFREIAELAEKLEAAHVGIS